MNGFIRYITGFFIPYLVLAVGVARSQEVGVSFESVAISSAPATEKFHGIPVDPDDPLVKKYIGITTGVGRRSMQAALDRMALYRPMILKYIQEAEMPRELLYLPIMESEYQNSAVSSAGAVGLWQMMVPTGRASGLKINYWVDERRDPEKATRAALRCLKDLHTWFEDWPLALAAYNRGVYGIQRDMAFTRSTDFSDLVKRQGLPKETEHYVPKLMASILIADNASDYGFTLLEDREGPLLEDVTLSKPLDLQIAGRCAGIPEREIRDLNPSLRLWCTPKNEVPFVLKIPSGRKTSFLEALAQVKDWTPVPDMVKYRIKKGDFLGKIAKQYDTSVNALKKDNRIQNAKRLRPGQVLIVRPGRLFKGPK